MPSFQVRFRASQSFIIWANFLDLMHIENVLKIWLWQRQNNLHIPLWEILIHLKLYNSIDTQFSAGSRKYRYNTVPNHIAIGEVMNEYTYENCGNSQFNGNPSECKLVIVWSCLTLSCAFNHLPEQVLKLLTNMNFVHILSWSVVYTTRGIQTAHLSGLLHNWFPYQCRSTASSLPWPRSWRYLGI